CLCRRHRTVAARSRGARGDGTGGPRQGAARARSAGRRCDPRGGDRPAEQGAGGVTASVLFYVQHLLGVGHLQRSLRIAEALVRDGVTVTLVSGGPPAALPRGPVIRFVQLPP